MSKFHFDLGCCIRISIADARSMHVLPLVGDLHLRVWKFAENLFCLLMSNVFRVWGVVCVKSLELESAFA